MTALVHRLIEQYGLLAVFLGCLAEGETAAILGGFFAHQRLFAPWQAALAAFCGAALGDTAFFLLGRHFASHPRVARLRSRPGFDRANRLLRQHPNLFVLSNRYIYGMRLVGGVAAGLAEIPLWRFVLLNAASALAWALLFTLLGYVFGLGAEQVLGRTLHAHQRLWLALGLGVAVALVAAARRHRQRARASS